MSTHLLVTGATYPNRRAIRALGGVWQADEKGYAAPLDKRDELEAIPGLEIQECNFEADPFRPLSPDELRAYRQARKNRHAQRLLDRADAANRRAKKARGRISEHEREFLRLGEPIKVGHHSERRHRKLIERANNADIEAGREALYAEKLRQRADFMQPALVKGDTETKRQKKREAADKIIEVGDTVVDGLYGTGVVTKVNAKTYTVNYTDRGFATTIDKSWARLVAKGNGPPTIARKFKAGDRVIARFLAARYEGIVKRRTSLGYSVEYQAYGRTRTETFSENSLEAAP